MSLKMTHEVVVIVVAEDVVLMDVWRRDQRAVELSFGDLPMVQDENALD